MVFRRSAFEEGRRGGAFSLPGAGCRSLGGRMPRSGGNHADDTSAFDAHGEGKGISGSDFPGFHAPSVIFSARSRRMVAWYAVFLSRKFKGMETVRSLPSPFIRAMYHWFPDRRAKAAHSPMADGGRTMVSSHTEGMFRTTSRSGESFGKAASMSAGLETQ